LTKLRDLVDYAGAGEGVRAPGRGREASVEE
jgi:hypothetical protein